jgi:hypothetical protein
VNWNAQWPNFKYSRGTRLEKQRNNSKSSNQVSRCPGLYSYRIQSITSSKSLQSVSNSWIRLWLYLFNRGHPVMYVLIVYRETCQTQHSMLIYNLIRCQGQHVSTISRGHHQAVEEVFINAFTSINTCTNMVCFHPTVHCIDNYVFSPPDTASYRTKGGFIVLYF